MSLLFKSHVYLCSCFKLAHTVKLTSFSLTKLLKVSIECMKKQNKNYFRFCKPGPRVTAEPAFYTSSHLRFFSLKQKHAAKKKFGRFYDDTYLSPFSSLLSPNFVLSRLADMIKDLLPLISISFKILNKKLSHKVAILNTERKVEWQSSARNILGRLLRRLHCGSNAGMQYFRARGLL